MLRVLDPDASVAFYEALGYERRGKLQFETAYNIYMGLPGDDDTLADEAWQPDGTGTFPTS